jgi:hypothetical protein
MAAWSTCVDKNQFFTTNSGIVSTPHFWKGHVEYKQKQVSSSTSPNNIITAGYPTPGPSSGSYDAHDHLNVPGGQELVYTTTNSDNMGFHVTENELTDPREY